MAPIHGNDDRQPVLDAMIGGLVSGRRWTRYRDCGLDAFVVQHDETQEYGIRGTFCGDRFCRFCTARRSAVIRRELSQWLIGRPIRFMTLTLKHSVESSLPELIDRMYEKFHAMRRLKLWRQHVEGGASFLEVKRSAAGWHVHVHVLMEGRFFPKEWLSQLWENVTRDSKIVDIRQPKGEDAARYCAKYAAKGWTADVPLAVPMLRDLIAAMQGRRTVLAFGTWFRRFSITKLLDCGMDDIDKAQAGMKWKGIGSFSEILQGARLKDERCVKILTGLGRLYLCPQLENSS